MRHVTCREFSFATRTRHARGSECGDAWRQAELQAAQAQAAQQARELQQLQGAQAAAEQAAAESREGAERARTELGSLRSQAAELEAALSSCASEAEVKGGGFLCLRVSMHVYVVAICGVQHMGSTVLRRQSGLGTWSACWQRESMIPAGDRLSEP